MTAPSAGVASGVLDPEGAHRYIYIYIYMHLYIYIYICVHTHVYMNYWTCDTFVQTTRNACPDPVRKPVTTATLWLMVAFLDTSSEQQETATQQGVLQNLCQEGIEVGAPVPHHPLAGVVDRARKLDGGVAVDLRGPRDHA